MFFKQAKRYGNLKSEHNRELVVAVVGLGYVGLPLCIELAKHWRVIGYDINKSRVTELADGVDATAEVSRGAIMNAHNLSFSSDRDSISCRCLYYHRSNAGRRIKYTRLIAS